MGVSRHWILVICFFVLLGLFGCSPSKNEPDIEVAVQPPELVEINSPSKLSVTLNRINLGTSVPVRLELEDPPTSLNAPALTVTNSKASLTLTASTEGTYNLTLKASTDTLSKTVPFTLNVKKVMGFAVSATPTQLNLSPSQKGSVSITINRGTLPETTPIRVKVKNPSAEISSTPIRINGSTGTLEISASKIGTYELTLQAIGGDFKKEIPFIVKVGSSTLAKETVATGLEVPWDLTFTPDGTLYFTERKGTIKRVVNGVTETILHPLPVWAETEAGLMGMDFDPDYPSEPYLYVCYSYRPGTGVINNRVSRLELSGNTLTNEDILIDAIPGNTNHDGCRITFGPDKKLYITTGDAKIGLNSQDTNILSGKVLRINADGSLPSDNPFSNAVWSYGHRNAQGIVFHSNGKLYSNEHGESSEDEVNIITKGGNYGWPYVEGMCNTVSEQDLCDTQPLINPITTFFGPVVAPSGLSVYSGDMFQEWKGNLLLASLRGNKLYRLILDSSGNFVSSDILVDGDYGRLRDVEVAPDGSIYLAVSNRDGRAEDPFPKDEDDQIIRWSKQ